MLRFLEVNILGRGMTQKTHWRAVTVAYVVGVVAAMQVGRVAPATDALRADIGLDLATLGWAVSLITLASAVLGLAAGYLVVATGWWALSVLIIGFSVIFLLPMTLAERAAQASTTAPVSVT